METTWDKPDNIQTNESSQPAGCGNVLEPGRSNSVTPESQVLPMTNQKVYELPDYQAPPKPQTHQPKHQSLYLPAASRFERQESIIVGTPGFREKYGKFRSTYDQESSETVLNFDV